MAAISADQVVVELEARVERYRRDVNQARREFERNMQQVQRSAGIAESRVTGAFRGIGAAVGIIGGAALLRGAQQLVDASTRIENALRVAGLAGEELADVYDQLFESSQRNAAPLEEMVRLYSRVALAQDELGVSSAEIVDLVDTVGMAVRVSGGDAQQASGAILQLSQALGGGVVRAEEFNSLIEGLPGVLQAAANGIEEANGSVNKLRQLVIEGRLSSRAFFDGIAIGSNILEERLGSAELTISQSFLRLRNVLIDTAGDFDDLTDASASVNRAIGELSDIIEALGNMMDHVADSQIANFVEKLTRPVMMMAELREHIGGIKNLPALLGAVHGVYQDRARGIDPDERYAQNRIDGAFAPGETTEKTSRPFPNVPVPTPRPDQSRRKVSVDDPRYNVDPSSSKGGRSSRSPTDRYEDTLQRIRERTEAIRAETEAMRGLNPLVDDYGFAVEKARIEQDLLTEAKRAGLTVTPELRAQISQLADEFATASAAAVQLADSQDEVRRRAEEMADARREVVGGFATDLLNGASAADALSNALGRVADMLLNNVLDAIFQVNGATGGGPSGFLSSIFGGGGNLFSSSFTPNTTLGAVIGLPGRASGGPVKRGQPYIVGEERPEVFVPDQSGTIFPRVPDITGGSASVLEVALSPDLVAQILQQAEGQSVRISRNAVKKNTKMRRKAYENGAQEV